MLLPNITSPNATIFFFLHSLQLDQLSRLTLLNRQQPQEPSGSWQQVAPSQHWDLESGQMTTVSPLRTWNHHKHTEDLEWTDSLKIYK